MLGAKKMNKETRSDCLEKLVDEQMKKHDHHTFKVKWRGEDIHPPIIKVDKHFLRYRLQSGRTKRKQIEYVEMHLNLERDLFEDPESEIAQKAQHEILLGMIDEAGLKKDLYGEGQQQPAIITYDGYVLNGNRRLAAIRENDKIQFMDCVVLPKSANPKDLYELEIDLQMAKETKADYNWVDELLHLREGLENQQIRESEKVLAKKMKISPQQLKNKLDMLRLVDLYLKWLGKQGKYFIFGEKDEQVFIELEKFSRKLKNPEEQKIAREIVFGILQNPPSEGRLYKHITRVFKHFDETLINFKNKMKDSLPPKVSEKHEKDALSPTDDPLKTLAGKADLNKKKEVAMQISKFFNNPASAEKNIETLLEASEDAEASVRDKKDRNASYDRVSNAQRQLQGTIIDSSTSNVEAIFEKLKEIIRISNELLVKIQKLK